MQLINGYLLFMSKSGKCFHKTENFHRKSKKIVIIFGGLIKITYLGHLLIVNDDKYGKRQ